MPTPSKNQISENKLSEETGADRRSIKKWLAADGIEAMGGFYDRKAAIRCIKQHKKPAADPLSDDTDGDGGGSKKSPFAEKTAQEVIKLKRENRIADKLEAETYMETDSVEKMMLMGISKIENIPSKLESEFGLPQNVIKRLTALLDESRHEWSKSLKGMGE